MTIEDRLTDIEIKLSRQEDLVEALNQIVYQQQKKIDELEALCAVLARRIKELAGADMERSFENEKPPHY